MKHDEMTNSSNCVLRNFCITNMLHLLSVFKFTNSEGGNCLDVWEVCGGIEVSGWWLALSQLILTMTGF